MLAKIKKEGTSAPSSTKRTKKLALFDVLMTSAKSNAHVKADLMGSKPNDNLAPKNFVYKKKRKVMSTLKKKILLERLKRQIEANAAQSKLSEAPIDVGRDSYVCIIGFVAVEELEDEDEKMEIVGNVKDLLNSFGSLSSLEISKREASGKSICVVTAGFVRASDAWNASIAINGTVFSGVAIKSCLLTNLSTALTYVQSDITDSAPNSDMSISRPGKAILYLENMLSPSDVTDSDEVEEVLHDLQQLCGGYAGIKNCWIETRSATNSEISTENSTLSARYMPRTTTSSVTTLDSDLQMIEFPELRCALLARSILDKSYSVGLYNTAAYRRGLLTVVNIDNSDYGLCFGIRIAGLVEHYSLTDEEEKTETVSDIVQLIRGQQSTNSDELSILGLIFVPSSRSDLMDAVVWMSSVNSAAETASGLEKRVVGGSRLIVDVVRLYSAYFTLFGQVYDNAVDAEVIHASGDFAVLSVKNSNPKGLVTILRDCSVSRISSASQLSKALIDCDSDGKSVVACVAFSDLNGAQEAMMSLEGSVIGGHSVMAYVEFFDHGNEETAEEPSSSGPSENLQFPSSDVLMQQVSAETKFEATPECLYYELITPSSVQNAVQDSVGVELSADGDAKDTSKYGPAKLAPKLAIHSAPKADFKTASDEINGYVKELLTLISSFQTKAKEKNPNLPKQKHRFMAGIKQSLQAVKGSYAKLILVAPNSEASEALDEKIDVLLSEAQSRSVPILYCLTKRALGKAAQMTMKQTVIAVVDPNGAYELFKKILQFINALN